MVLTITMVYSGCSKLDIDFDASYDANLMVQVPPSGMKNTGYHFLASATIDPMSDPDFSKYANKIKDVKVKEVVAEVTSVSKPVTILNCDLSMSATGYDTALWSFTNESVVVGKKFTLGNNSGEWDKVQTILSDKKELTITIEGHTDQDDVQFTIKVTVKSDVTANPL